MAELYSRYAPPKKKQKTDPAPPPLISATQQTPSSAEHITHVKLDASSTYMRHVPSSAPKSTLSIHANRPVRAKTQSNDRNLESAVLGDADMHPRTAKDESTKDGKEVFQSDAMDVDTPTKREEMRKKEKKPTSEPEHVVGGVAADGESEGDTRHASILARRNKSLQKVEKLAKKAAKNAIERNGEDIDEDVDMKEPTELHSLEPLPQPEPVLESTSEPKFSALPQWMADPTKVGPAVTASFSDFGIQENVISTLRASGLEKAFAVQAAVLPLLLPGPRQHVGDVVVSAATGSGKTLAYVLPMIEDISSSSITMLRGLIVVPTKELVSQAKKVCDLCATAFSDHKKHKHVKIGVSMGDQSLKKEQAALMNQEDQGQQDDPASYQEEEWARIENCGGSDSAVVDGSESFSTSPNHMPHPTSNVDLLICTPGRLVEHLNSTPGFTLQHLNWLVIDEADKLLGQSFQEWIGTVMAHLPTPLPMINDRSGFNARSPKYRMRKVVLSATMTSDAGQVSSLKLQYPKFVVLEGLKNDVEAGGDGETRALPVTLHETAIKVHDDADKPLYLLELLQSLKAMDMDSQGDSSSTALSSDDDSELQVDDISSGDESSHERSIGGSARLKENSSFARPQPITKPRGTVIFTKSNENAHRLSRLLTLLDQNFESVLGTLTSEIPKNIRRKTLAAFQSGKLSVLVASDLASRGLDILSLANVVNYDMPSNLDTYVHRVGRTARAGKKGNAWTFFTKTEAAWFLNQIVRSNLVNRNSGTVEMSKIDPNTFGDELRARYEKALERLGEEARGRK